MNDQLLTMSDRRYFWLLIRASFLSALQTAMDRGIIAAFRKVARVFWFMASKPATVPWQEMQYRLQYGCGQCVIYDRKVMTCGRFGDPNRLGCLCFMPHKAAYRDVQCWLWDHTNGKHGFDFTPTGLHGR